MRSKLVVGNWKLNGNLQTNAALLTALKRGVSAVPGKRCAVCVPAPYLQQAHDLLLNSPILWGAQDASAHAAGAFTGEISAAMIAEFGSRLCLVGHSERRALFGDTDELVAQKLGRVKAAGLTPIACVGETLAERESGVTERVIGRQMQALIAAHGTAALQDVIFAYEPVWAIGTGKTATPQQAQDVHAFMRRHLALVDAELAQQVPILYGGSVKAGNARELFAMPDIDGGLVGGASLVAEEFLGIWTAL